MIEICPKGHSSFNEIMTRSVLSCEGLIKNLRFGNFLSSCPVIEDDRRAICAELS